MGQTVANWKITALDYLVVFPRPNCSKFTSSMTSNLQNAALTSAAINLAKNSANLELIKLNNHLASKSNFLFAISDSKEHLFFWGARTDKGKHMKFELRIKKTAAMRWATNQCFLLNLTALKRTRMCCSHSAICVRFVESSREKFYVFCFARSRIWSFTLIRASIKNARNNWCAFFCLWTCEWSVDERRAGDGNNGWWNEYHHRTDGITSRWSHLEAISWGGECTKNDQFNCQG